MKGQVAIIVLLVSAIMLTMGMSLSKGEITEVRLNTNDELLKKAFDVAESGLNYFIGTGGNSYSSPDGQSSALIYASKISDGSDKIDFGEFIPAGGNESYWLVNHLDNGDIGSTYFTGPNIDVCGVGFTGSFELGYFYKNGTNYEVKRYGYNFSSDTNYHVNGFTLAAGNCVSVDIINNPILITLMPIYNGGKFYIQANNGGLFSSQGVDIFSTGTSGGANKKLNVRQRFIVPGFMVSGMVAEGSILSN